MACSGTTDSGGISVVVLDGGDGANALSRPLCLELISTLDEAVAAGSRAIVLTGAGSSFSAGGDLKAIRAWGQWTHEERANYVHEGPQALMRWLLDAPVATVCAINGAAFGAGFDLTLACDLRIASDRAQLCEAFIRMNVVPGDGGAWLLPRHLGLGRALDLLMTGRVVEAPEAEELGLVSAVVPHEQLLEEAVATARGLSRRAPAAMVAIRRLAYDGMAETFDTHLAAAASALAIAAGTQEHAEAVERFFEGRARD